MPTILKSCFLYHYDTKINSDKVFNLFLIDHEDGTYSAISEHGRSETKLRVLPLVERCSLALAQNRFAEKRDEKIFHNRTPYLETFNCDYSPTLKEYAAFKPVAIPTAQPQPAKILDFKLSAKVQSTTQPTENQSGEQTTPETNERRKREIGTLNLNQLDALEL